MEIVSTTSNRLRHRLFSAAVVVVMTFIGLPQVVRAESTQDAEMVIDQAVKTWQAFMQDPDFSGFREHVKNVKGILIVPALLKGAFLVGLEGGNGVLLVRDEKTGEWSEPVFYETTAVSFGPQAGGERSEAILVIQTVKGIESLLSSSVKLGGDVSAAIGPKGGGMEGSTSTNPGKDFVTYSRSKGLYAGVSLEGASLRPKNDLNKSYYGSAVRPSDVVLVRNIKANPHSQQLREAVAKDTSGK